MPVSWGVSPSGDAPKHTLAGHGTGGEKNFLRQLTAAEKLDMLHCNK
jgi:hypothetical protein